MAKMVGLTGRVISADLQSGMLEQLSGKMKGTDLEARIMCVQCERNSISVSEKVDFILAFYMVHEVPDKASFFKQLKAVVKEKGQLLLVEPKLFHVSRKEFNATKKIAEGAGFKIVTGPKLGLSWSAVLTNA